MPEPLIPICPECGGQGLPDDDELGLFMYECQACGAEFSHEDGELAALDKLSPAQASLRRFRGFLDETTALLFTLAGQLHSDPALGAQLNHEGALQLVDEAKAAIGKLKRLIPEET